MPCEAVREQIQLSDIAHSHGLWDSWDGVCAAYIMPFPCGCSGLARCSTVVRCTQTRIRLFSNPRIRLTLSQILREYLPEYLAEYTVKVIWPVQELSLLIFRPERSRMKRVLKSFDHQDTWIVCTYALRALSLAQYWTFGISMRSYSISLSQNCSQERH